MVVHCPRCQARLRLAANLNPDELLSCPKCGGRFRAPTPDADDEDEPRRPVKSSPGARRSRRDHDDDEEPAGNWTGKRIALYAVIAVVGLGSVGAAAYFVTRPGNTGQTAAKPKPDPVDPGPPARPIVPSVPMGPDGLPIMPEDVKDLFAAEVDRLAPTVHSPTLVAAKDVEFEMPSFAAATRKAKADPPAGGKLSVEEVKKAVVYIQLEARDKSATGSGFLIRIDGDVGLIATNHHVVAPAALQQLILGWSGPGGASVKVVFDSGMPTETVKDAVVIAADPKVDLAILKVAGVPRNLKPIDPRQATRPTETLSVLICGFPLGQALASGKRGPNITIGKGAVSSVHLRESGEVSEVQIDGAINPGNSGGPLVDADGRLVGIAVSTFRGTGIGFAVPTEELVSLLDGRVLTPGFQPIGMDGDMARFRAATVVSDPLKQVKSVALVVGEPGSGPAVRGADGLWPAVTGGTAFELKPTERGVAEGDLRLPRTTSEAVVQLTCTYVNGVTIRSRPVPYQLAISSAHSARTTLPLTTLVQNPEQYTGQVVGVRALVGVTASDRYTRVYQLHVENPDTAAQAPPLNLEFLAPREISTLLDEQPVGVEQVSARLTCLVGKPGADGRTPLRVLSVAILGPGGRVEKTLPYVPQEPLSRLNLNPEQFVGQKLTLEGLIQTQTIPIPGQPELPVMLAGGRRAQNVMFTCTPTLAQQLDQLAIPFPSISARLNCRVEDYSAPGGRRAQVATVTRIEILDFKGRVLKTLE